MFRINFSALPALVGAFALSSVLVPSASATVIGAFNITNCAGGGVTVSALAITWLPPTLGGTAGCITTGIGSSITYSGGAVGAGAVGDILNLIAGPPMVIDNFMTFVGTTLDFQLAGLGPANPTNGTTCAGLLTNESCIAATGSPFKLTRTAAGGTDVSLAANGFIIDGGLTSLWAGGFTTQLAASPESIQTTILGGGSVSNTHSAQFTITVVPEPGSLALLLSGAGLLAVGRFRRRRS